MALLTMTILYKVAVGLKFSTYDIPGFFWKVVAWAEVELWRMTAPANGGGDEAGEGEGGEGEVGEGESREGKDGEHEGKEGEGGECDSGEGESCEREDGEVLEG